MLSSLTSLGCFLFLDKDREERGEVVWNATKSCPDESGGMAAGTRRRPKCPSPLSGARVRILYGLLNTEVVPPTATFTSTLPFWNAACSASAMAIATSGGRSELEWAQERRARPGSSAVYLT